jgi:glutamate-1-semialdehyde 2,1-aminomutase
MKQTERPEGNRGWQLYERAKQLIPGGTQLLSKRPELYLPQGWPCYYERAKGCEIWNLDGRRFIDMTTSAIGACVLGYADSDVNDAVKQCIDAGSVSTLMVPSEVALAQRLCSIHPWAQMVRYARTGGEAMAVAVRIARACTGRSHIAVCGYHGWCDWYLAANLSSNQALDGHLLQGLRPTGVPRELTGTVHTFRYNQIDQLSEIVNHHGSKLAAIVMEPMRYTSPVPRFLASVREIAASVGAILIFDEVSAAWRHRLGGLHLQFSVHPDIAVLPKRSPTASPWRRSSAPPA